MSRLVVERQIHFGAAISDRLCVLCVCQNLNTEFTELSVISVLKLFKHGDHKGRHLVAAGAVLALRSAAVEKLVQQIERQIHFLARDGEGGREGENVFVITTDIEDQAVLASWAVQFALQ